MGVENLKSMKDQLVNCVQGQLGDLQKVDTHQLGEAIDMIKDLSEAIYYCIIVESMEKSNQDKGGDTINYYTTPVSFETAVPASDKSNVINYYTEMPDMKRDPREGRSPIRRRMYMEGKQKHHDATSQLRELEAYLQELSNDVVEMVKGATQEEKATLRQKMMTLVDKIN